MPGTPVTGQPQYVFPEVPQVVFGAAGQPAPSVESIVADAPVAPDDPTAIAGGVHDPGSHAPFVQNPLAQSSPAAHRTPRPHNRHVPPPQIDVGFLSVADRIGAGWRVAGSVHAANLTLTIRRDATEQVVGAPWAGAASTVDIGLVSVPDGVRAARRRAGPRRAARGGALGAQAAESAVGASRALAAAVLADDEVPVEVPRYGQFGDLSRAGGRGVVPDTNEARIDVAVRERGEGGSVALVNTVLHVPERSPRQAILRATRAPSESCHLRRSSRGR